MVNFRIFNDVHNALRPKSNKDGCQQGRRAANLLGVCHCQTGPRGHWELAEQGHSKCGSVDRDEQLFNELYFVFKLGVDCTELARRFPSYNARGATSRKRPSTSSSTNSMSRGKKNGRPNKTIIHKDLVIIPNPDTNQVPSHVSKVKLEERGLIIHQLPFNKDWTHLDLKRNIESQLPRDDIMFEYLKVSYYFLFVFLFIKRNKEILKTFLESTTFLRAKCKAICGDKSLV